MVWGMAGQQEALWRTPRSAKVENTGSRYRSEAVARGPKGWTAANDKDRGI